MGCTSVIAVEQRKILPLPPQTVNSYIDKFPAIILQKVKEKFEAVADPETKQINKLSFLQLYRVAKMGEEPLIRLFEFFNDHRKDNLRFRSFMSKYAIITKCQPQMLFKIFFEVYKNNPDQERMTRQQFEHFLSISTQFIQKKPFTQSLSITAQEFASLVGKANFNEKQYQRRLIITTEEDIPFLAINRQLQECDFDDFEVGQSYHLLSNSWFNRWSFYYQEVNHSVDKAHIKSTKMLLPLENNRLMRNRRKSFIQNSKKRASDSSILRTSQMGSSLIEQPHSIEFDDIEGEYRGELKQNLKISSQVRIISSNLWILLCTLHPPQQDFKRVAISEDAIEYYPKTVFYLQANKSGQLILASQTVKNLSLAANVGSLYGKQLGQALTFGAFTKNFEEKDWREVDLDKKGADVSLNPRIFIVFAENREKFIQGHSRKEISAKNITLGDKVIAYFPYTKSYSEAIVIGVCENDKFKVHFKGYSYKYELQLNRSDLKLEGADAERPISSRKKNQSLIKGITNVGNTCFMNSIIECLVATPVLDKFLQEFPFDQKKNPIGYGLSKIAKSLLKNQKPSPIQFKKLIDIHMPLFSGYDQHDAQEFLNLLLDKMSEELPEKPTIIDYLFGGKTKSQLSCLSCKKVKNIDEKMYILSLPLPQAEFNYYSVIVVPISGSNIKKIIFKLHRNATVKDYVTSFEERTGDNSKNFVFCQTNNNSLKKMQMQLTTVGYEHKKVIDIGIVPNISLIAFQKIPSRVYFDLLRKKKEDQFKDFMLKAQAYWTICRIVDKQVDKNDKILVEYINQENQLERTKIQKTVVEQFTDKIGSHSNEYSYKKIILRKHNASLKKLEHFGIEFLIGIPRWASYNDIMVLVEKYLNNLKSKEAKAYSEAENGDYIVRLLDPVKLRCIFCLKDNQYFGITQSDLKPCCSAFEKDIPLAWAFKYKSFWIYVDWINFSACNASFCNYIDVDAVSRRVEEARQEQFINLQDCIQLHKQNQKVEMQCDFCKHGFQNLEHLIGEMPNILVVHMKEFRYTAEGHLIKLDLRLKWQEYLDSSKFALTTQGGKLYELFALVRHSGNSQSGHYTCMAKRKHPFENKKVWVNFDDDITEIVKQQQKFIDDAYLLVYKKVDMPTSSLVIYSDLAQN